jgi:hypothetical protein
MNGPSKRLAVVPGWPAVWPLQSAAVLLGLLLIFSAPATRSQEAQTGPPSVRSVSGQFVVSAQQNDSPWFRRANFAADTNLVRLDPALLAVSAERFKLALWAQLGIRPGSTWSGKIFLTLYPAQSTNDNVNIEIVPLPNAWSYRVQLPNVVNRTRFARALTGVLLLEIANRANPNAGHSAELPPWLTDGLARQILGGEQGKLILSAPSEKTDALFLSGADSTKVAGGVYESRVDNKERGSDPLADARRILQDTAALTYDELCWPSDAQMNGYDGGAYFASAQLFANSLLGLEGGAEKMRTFLNQLPGCMNWQTAFYAAFHEQFKRPLDVEKWWTLRVIRFAVRDPGPRWTADSSRERLADLLAVPVEFRDAPDSLPDHTVISLQSAIRNFQSGQLAAILEIKRRDFEMAQFRMAQPFAVLADGYRAVLTDFLGTGRKTPRLVIAGKTIINGHHGLSVAEAVRRLDALDARRRDLEAKLDASAPPKTLNP